ncbi:hypothetical protein DPMN_005129 [Dreissena polymorpha]|uniref:Uncharacterized protein n=1 Tax=Dreissena polymorpha TaxID=45954 RepID=A0A9D4RTL4_DREPO|nr:hypothetical protein DPMN_005129 [Dreissena polymorpha]
MEVDAEVSSDHEGGGGMAATHGFMREVAVALMEVVSKLRVLKGQSHYSNRGAVYGDVPIGFQYVNERDIEHFGNGRSRVQHAFEGQREGRNVLRQQRDDGYTGRRNTRPVPKMPPFTGKEEWTVWSAKFEAIARSYSWDEDDKLDNLLPMIEGQASEFVFAQLPTEFLSDYHELTTE